MNNLADIYQTQGKLILAKELYEKSFELLKKVLGEKHPDTIMSLNNLASIYHDIGQLGYSVKEYKGAFEYYDDALELYQYSL